jgi:hypothetical protein
MSWLPLTNNAKVKCLRHAARRKWKFSKNNFQRPTRKLERLGTPRHLTAEQKDKLSAFLRASLKGKMTIFASASVSDATDYAKEIAKVFAETGWQIPPVLTPLFVGGDVTGTWITVRGPDVPQAAQIVFEALKAANIQIRDQAMGDNSPNGPAPDEVWLKIGTPK